MPVFSNVSLSELAQGAAEEEYQHALKRVLENLLDPNCSPKRKRKITMVIEFTVDEKRQDVTVDVAARTTLQARTGARTHMQVMADDKGVPFGHEPELLPFRDPNAN